ncbi:MAG: L-fucose/L-arabinose isomerase family protein [Candidatus Avoscillospira sp.]
MYDFKKIVLGYAPTRRFDFPDPKLAYANSLKIRQRIDEICQKLGDIELVDLSFLNEEGLLYQDKDVPAVAKRFREAGVDAVFMPHANFGCEEVVASLGRAMGLPILIWGPRDEAPPGGYCFRQTDTQCGLFASSMALLRQDIPFSYIENCWLDSPVLEEKLDEFVRAVSVVKAFRHMKIGLVGQRPKPFLSVMVDESELVHKFGVNMVPFDGTEFTTELERVRREEKDAVQALIDEARQALNCTTKQPEELEISAASELALRHMAETYGCTVLAGDCWAILPLLYQIYPCYIFGNLTEKGLPVICENDVYGAVTATLLTAAARGRTPSFTADLTIRHPYNDNAELLWHCGPFPKSLAKQACEPELEAQCFGRYEIVGGDLTIARFGGIGGKFKLFFGEGKGVEGPVTGGNYIWAEVSDWPKWERKLIYGPYIHHACGIHGKYANALREACRYLDIEADPAD